MGWTMILRELIELHHRKYFLTNRIAILELDPRAKVLPDLLDLTMELDSIDDRIEDFLDDIFDSPHYVATYDAEAVVH